MTLATLLNTDLLVLHVTGPSKLETLQRASSPGSALEMPVRALLEQSRVPLEVYHAP
jgi:6-phosphogluconolactonase